MIDKELSLVGINHLAKIMMTQEVMMAQRLMIAISKTSLVNQETNPKKNSTTKVPHFKSQFFFAKEKKSMKRHASVRH